MYCLDASVIISAARATEPYSERSKAFLDRIREERIKIFLPEIILLEVASALVRNTENHEFALAFARSLRDFENFSLVSLDSKLTDSALTVIAETGLRGPDAVYVALAYEYKLALITLDREQLSRSRNLIAVQQP